MRNAIEIGRAPVAMDGSSFHGTQVYVLLDGEGPGMSRFVPGRRALRWMSVPQDHDRPEPASSAGIVSDHMAIPTAFASDVYDVLVPGTTVVLTDSALQADAIRGNEPLLQADESLQPWIPKGP